MQKLKESLFILFSYLLIQDIVAFSKCRIEYLPTIIFQVWLAFITLDVRTYWLNVVWTQALALKTAVYYSESKKRYRNKTISLQTTPSGIEINEIKTSLYITQTLLVNFIATLLQMLILE